GAPIRQCDEWAEQDADAARTLIPALVKVIRALLIEHKMMPSGDCRICQSAWPCPVMTTIRALLKDRNTSSTPLSCGRTATSGGPD
ncbi:MAG TPA: hypothetical protein VFO16_10255, partial [Pseudonocardiaceae bacterium]|nr:hypothetical protein [Pseudonocardiaceae bacterium]